MMNELITVRACEYIPKCRKSRAQRDIHNYSRTANNNLPPATAPSALSRTSLFPRLSRLVTVMSDSDGEYVADDLSDEDIAAHQVSRHGTRSSGPVRGAVGSATRGGDTNTGSNRRRAAWEDIQRSWDTVVEGADGSINSTVEGLREAGKRKR
jgi:hypothetical protein